MKFRNIYNDVVSRVSQLDVDRSKLFHYDYLDAINDSIAELIVMYGSKEMFDGITHTEVITFNMKDFEYSLLYSADLEKKINKNFKPKNAIVNCLVQPITLEGKTGEQSYSKGTLVVFKDYVYECLDSYTLQDHLENETEFDGTNIREYTPGSGVQYKRLDILKFDNLYYRCIQDFIATDKQHDIETDTINFSQIFWIKKQPVYFNSRFIAFDDLNDMLIYSKMKDVYMFSVYGDKLYMNQNPKRVVLTYIPEWEDITNLDTEITFPRTMVSDIKLKALEKIAVKLNVGK